MILQEMPPSQAERLRETAGREPLSDPGVVYPEWYLHRWHFLPEGYLSGRSAAGYDRVIRNVYNVLQEHRIARDVARRISSFKPVSVLEVGAGPGRLLAKLSRIPSVKHLTGVDLSPYLLERATSRLRGRGVELLHHDALNLPGPDGEFDVATASHYVGHLPGPLGKRAVDELARSVRLGGHVVIVDHRWHSWPETNLLRKTAEAIYGLGSIRLSVFERIEGVSA
jgi:ubiquinone/menaquinone biosynthesis C-methylase UbiE